MLFDATKARFESYKERNLYYKFFAGYFFNELVEGCNKRLEAFYALLRSPKLVYGQGIVSLQTPKADSVRISFDNHGAQWGLTDRGEFADILICDELNKMFIAIEAKYLANWTLDKDVEKNASRIKEVSLRPTFQDWTSVQCLLVTRQKWQDGVGKLNNNELIERQSEIVVLLWEQFVEQTDNKRVREYMSHQLKMNRNDFLEKI